MDLIFQEKKHDRISLEEWLCWWARVVAPIGGATYNEIPFWLKILPRIFFLAINNSVSGIISKKELESFYGSVVGLDSDKISKYLDMAYNSLTSVKILLSFIIKEYIIEVIHTFNISNTLYIRYIYAIYNLEYKKKKKEENKTKKNVIFYNINRKTRGHKNEMYRMKWE